MLKEFFVHGALAKTTEILTLQDPNPHNLTYGYLDRNFYSRKKDALFIFSRLIRRENKRWKIFDDLRAKSWMNVVTRRHYPLPDRNL